MSKERKSEIIANKLMINFLLSILFGAVLLFLQRGYQTSAASLTRSMVMGMAVIGFVGMIISYFYIKKKGSYIRWDGTFAALFAGCTILVWPGVITKYAIYGLFCAIPVYWVLMCVYYLAILPRIKKQRRKSNAKQASK